MGQRLLEAIRPLFSPATYRLRDNGAFIGELNGSWLRETAELDLGDTSYSFYREQIVGGDYIIDHKGTTVARATKLKWYRSDLDVELFKRSVKLRRPFVLSRRFGVFEADNRVGTIYPAWLISARIDLPTDFTVLDQAFLFWLCTLMWRRQPDWLVQIS